VDEKIVNGAAVKDATEKDMPVGSKTQILVVEDEPHIRDSMGMLPTTIAILWQGRFCSQGTSR
jgi:hypothetical protein